MSTLETEVPLHSIVGLLRVKRDNLAYLFHGDEEGGGGWDVIGISCIALSLSLSLARSLSLPPPFLTQEKDRPHLTIVSLQG